MKEASGKRIKLVNIQWSRGHYFPSTQLYCFRYSSVLLAFFHSKFENFSKIGKSDFKLHCQLNFLKILNPRNLGAGPLNFAFKGATSSGAARISVPGRTRNGSSGQPPDVGKFLKICPNFSRKFKMHYFSIYFQRFSTPCFNFLRPWKKITN